MLMKKIAAGDRSAVTSLCIHLADRLMFVPTISTHSDVTGTTRVIIVRINEAEGVLVPAFTTDKAFAHWKATTGHSGESLQLLGADLCTAIGEGIGLLVDPGSEISIKLSPEDVASIANTQIEDIKNNNNAVADNQELGRSPKALAGSRIENENQEPSFGEQEVAPASHEHWLNAGVGSSPKGAAVEPMKKPIVVPPHSRTRKDTTLDLLRPELDPTRKRIRDVDETKDSVTSTVIRRSSLTLGVKEVQKIRDMVLGDDKKEEISKAESPKEQTYQDAHSEGSKPEKTWLGIFSTKK